MWPTADFGEWLGAVVVAKSIAIASNMLTPLMILPMMGSAFVPTDFMPAGLNGSRLRESCCFAYLPAAVNDECATRHRVGTYGSG